MLINLKIKMFFNYGIKLTSFQQNYEPSKISKIHLLHSDDGHSEGIWSNNIPESIKDVWNVELVSTRWMHCKLHDSWWAVQFLLKDVSHLVCVHLQNQGTDEINI